MRSYVNAAKGSSSEESVIESSEKIIQCHFYLYVHTYVCIYF